MDRYTHIFKDTAQMPEGERIKVTACLHYIKGNSAPYFSVTAEGFNRRGRETFGGCCHDEILKYWPGLAPVIALHLSDDNGAPMYASANGLYHLGVGEYSKRNDTAAMEHFRVDAEGLETIRKAWEANPTPFNWELIIRSMRARWAAEAREGIALLDSLEASNA